MPTVEFQMQDLLNLIGADVPLSELEERASMLGTSVEEIDKDHMVVEIFPNRPDMLSVEGFARAYRTFTGLESGLREYRVEDADIQISVDTSVSAVRPYIVSAIVKNIPVTEEVLLSIINMQEALHTSHGRKRKKVAIGIHDFDKTTPPYKYTAVDPNSLSFVPLDFTEEMTLAQALKQHPKGRDYSFILEGKALLPVVLDAKGVVSLPPIINAERTRVTTNTTNLFIEMTGTNKPALNHALDIVLSSLADRGGQIVSIDVAGERHNMKPREMKLRSDYANQLLGLNLKPSKISELLSKMGYNSTGGSTLRVQVPCYRADVLHPIDIVEDLAIAYGYEKFIPQEPHIPTIGVPDPLEEASFNLKMLMLGLGFQEISPFTLTNEEELRKARIDKPYLRIRNPRTEEFTIVRPSVIPSLLSVLAYNKKKKIPQRIFELDDVVLPKDNKNHRILGIAVINNVVNLSEMQSVVEALLRSLGVEYSLKEADYDTFIPGRSAEILVGKPIGVFGEVHPQVLDNFGLDYPVLIAEISAEELL